MKNKNKFAASHLMKPLWVAAVLLLSFAPSGQAIAQSMGTIQGTVKDPSGSVVPGARITLTNTDTGDHRTASSNPEGAFNFPALVTGHYTIKVEKEGFKTEQENGLTLEVAQQLVVNPALQVGSQDQEVTVTGAAELVNTTNSALGNVVSEKKIAELPINGRNYIDLVTMQPGINVATGATGTGATGGSRGTYFSADGAPFRSNMYLYDGAIVLNGRGGGSASESGNTLGMDGIKEFKVVLGTYGAEYGNSIGAQVVMVSKNGTNQFHGDVFEYIRNSIFDARNYFDYGYQQNGKRIPHLERNNFGGSFGGPIAKNKLFFFGAYEGLKTRQGQTILDTVPAAGCHGAAGTTITVAACPNLTANTVVSTYTAKLLALYPLPNVGTTQWTPPNGTPEPINDNWFQGRVDYNISSRDTLFGRYTSDKSDFSSGSGSALHATSAGVAWPQFRSDQNSYIQSTSISENHIFTPQLLNTFRIAYTRVNYQDVTNYTAGDGGASLTGPGLSFTAGLPVGSLNVGGLSTFGTDPNYPTTGRLNYYIIGDDLYYTHGKHTLKFGYLGVKWNLGNNLGSNRIGTLQFSNFTNFLNGAASQWSGLTNANTAITDHNVDYFTHGFYTQDDYKPLSNLTVNLGLRYEFMTTPWDTRGNGFNYGLRNIATDLSTTPGPMIQPPSKVLFSPRVGFALDVFKDGKTSIRGGYGEYYEVGNIVGLIINSQAVPPLAVKGTHVNTGAALQQFTLPLTFTGADAKGVQMTDYNLKTPTLQKWTLTAEQQLPLHSALSITYNGTHGYHLYQGVEGNPTQPVFANNTPFWNGTQPRLNPNLGATTNFTTSHAATKYNALVAQLATRTRSGIESQVSYTWSHNFDNTATQGGQGDCSAAAGMAQPVYANDPNRYDYGPSCFDVANTFRFNLTYHFPNVHGDNFGAALIKGWRIASIYSFNSGYPFRPSLSALRAQDANLGGTIDVPNVATGADALACPAISATCKFVPVPFNKGTVYTRTAAQWFNPNMFVMTPMYVSAGGPACTTATCPTPASSWGTIGNVRRGLLRGPNLSNLDLSLAKETALKFIGDQGKLEFRWEVFNALNHANFAMPSTATFAGGTSPVVPYSVAPLSTAGQITSTIADAREMQFALRIEF